MAGQYLLDRKGQTMDLTMNYQHVRDFVDSHNWDQLLEALNLKTNLDLYSVSTDWYKLGRQFILKAKGAKGDLIISWG